MCLFFFFNFLMKIRIDSEELIGRILMINLIKNLFVYFISFSYQNLTNKLKREWYNFQVGTNEFLTEIFGEDEEEEPVRNSYQQIKDKNDVQ